MPTALLTGASSGIGLELAKQFAAGGDNVVLTARSEDKVVKIANVLEQLYNVSAIIIPCVLSMREQVSRQDARGLARASIRAKHFYTVSSLHFYGDVLL